MKQRWLIPSLAAAPMAAGCGSNRQPPGQDAGAGWQTCTDQQGRRSDDADLSARHGDRGRLDHRHFFESRTCPFEQTTEHTETLSWTRRAAAGCAGRPSARDDRQERKAPPVHLSLVFLTIVVSFSAA